MIKGLTKDQNDLVIQILAFLPEIREVILYGSRAKGNHTLGSDIDLTLKGSDLDHSSIQKLMSKFDESTLPFTIDLSIYNQIQSKDLLAHIKRVGVCIYEKDLI